MASFPYNLGPEYYDAAATELFRAIAFCPNPVEVILMLENMVPKPVNEILLALFSLEVGFFFLFVNCIASHQTYRVFSVLRKIPLFRKKHQAD